MTRWLVSAVACSIALALVAGSAAASTATPLRRDALAPVTVAMLALEPAALALYARERGFFAQQGLDVKIEIFSGPGQVVPALLSGQVQFAGITSGGVAQMEVARVPVRLVAAAALDRQGVVTSGLVAGPGKKFGRARDLIGKRIAIDDEESIGTVALLKWLKDNGVASDQVELVTMAFPLMLAPLRRGQIDAAILPEPLLTQARRRGARLIAHTIRAVCPQDCLLTGYAARRDVDATIAAKFRNAIQAAAVWANQRRNDRASGEILAEYTKVDEATIATMTRSRFATRFRPAQAQPWIDAFAEFGVIPASFPAIELVR